MDAARGVGGFGPHLGAHIRVSIPDAEPRPRKGHILLSFFVLVDGEGTIHRVVVKIQMGNVHLVPGGHRHLSRGAVQYIQVRGLHLGDGHLDAVLPLRDGDHHSGPAIGDREGIVHIGFRLDLKDRAAQRQIGFPVILGDLEITDLFALALIRGLIDGRPVRGEHHIPVGGDAGGFIEGGLGLLGRVPKDEGPFAAAAVPGGVAVAVRLGRGGHRQGIAGNRKVKGRPALKILLPQGDIAVGVLKVDAPLAAVFLHGVLGGVLWVWVHEAGDLAQVLHLRADLLVVGGKLPGIGGNDSVVDAAPTGRLVVGDLPDDGLASHIFVGVGVSAGIGGDGPGDLVLLGLGEARVGLGAGHHRAGGGVKTGGLHTVGGIPLGGVEQVSIVGAAAGERITVGDVVDPLHIDGGAAGGASGRPAHRHRLGRFKGDLLGELLRGRVQAGTAYSGFLAEGLILPRHDGFTAVLHRRGFRLLLHGEHGLLVRSLFFILVSRLRIGDRLVHHLLFSLRSRVRSPVVKVLLRFWYFFLGGFFGLFRRHLLDADHRLQSVGHRRGGHQHQGCQQPRGDPPQAAVFRLLHLIHPFRSRRRRAEAERWMLPRKAGKRRLGLGLPLTIWEQTKKIAAVFTAASVDLILRIHTNS